MKNQIFTLMLLLCSVFCVAQMSEQGANQVAAEIVEVNSGYLLPEIMIAEEVQPSGLMEDEPELRADEFQKLDFRIYVKQVETQIASNEKVISSIKERVKTEKGKTAIKHWKEITTLEIQNEELKKNLWRYLHYGKGEWVHFQQDFNEDLVPLMEDLAQLEQELY